MHSLLVTGRLISRAFWNGIANVSATSDPNIHRKPESQLISAVCGFSKERKIQRLIKGQFGDDAWFTAKYKSADVLGVADGVGGWRAYGIDPGEFSLHLMKTCERLVKLGIFTPTNPSELLAKSYYELLHHKKAILGEKKRLRFTYEDDIVLLREVVSRNPFQNSDMWEEVKTSVFQVTKKLFSIKTIRQHIQLLLDQWIEKEKNNQKSSGVEEPYSERDVLLQEVKDFVEEDKQIKCTKLQNKKAQKMITESAKELRTEMAVSFYEANINNSIIDHNYVSNSQVIIEECDMNEDFEMASTSNKNNGQPSNSILVDEIANETPRKKLCPNIKNVLGPIRKRAKKTTYMRKTGLDYLKEKNSKELELEEKRLNIEERKVTVSERSIALAEKKFEFERSSTACVVVLNRDNNTLYTANIGDSGFMVVRKGKVIRRSEEQQHYFNTPFQLSLPPPGYRQEVLSDRPDAAMTDNIPVEDGDVQGERCAGRLQMVANSLAWMARNLSFDETFISPFAESAFANGINTIGGKPDDITVVLATVAI
ncbi:unnamed protein product [Psylliodes chrysocephalus]|uniref:Protein phosphatase n=1 Tax=Psylliodes chrysocephalus TaxID=3402493 RepID=A0A9P0G318_9CUCU|nr:unnamed protein product [Psylliodes chrysocephala]